MRPVLLALAVTAATLTAAPPSHALTTNCQLAPAGLPDEYDVYAGPLASGGVTSTTTFCDFKWHSQDAPTALTVEHLWPGGIGFVSGVRVHVTDGVSPQVTPFGTRRVMVTGSNIDLYACARTFSPEAGFRPHGCAYVRSF